MISQDSVSILRTHMRRRKKESEKHAEKKSAVLLGKHTSEVKKEKKQRVPFYFNFKDLHLLKGKLRKNSHL